MIQQKINASRLSMILFGLLTIPFFTYASAPNIADFKGKKIQITCDHREIGDPRDKGRDKLRLEITQLSSKDFISDQRKSDGIFEVLIFNAQTGKKVRPAFEVSGIRKLGTLFELTSEKLVNFEIKGFGMLAQSTMRINGEQRSMQCKTAVLKEPAQPVTLEVYAEAECDPDRDADCEAIDEDYATN